MTARLGRAAVAMQDEDLDWMHDAACRDEPTAVWFPHGNSTAEMIPAKEICSVCPVRRECLEYALVTDQPDGVWGGLTAGERKRLRKDRG